MREPEPYTDFLTPDPDLPAAPAYDYNIGELLDRIARNTEPRDQGLTWFPIHTQLPAAAGEQSFRIPLSVRFLYVPAVPRAVDIYAGPAREYLLARLDTGQTLTAELPFPTNGISIAWGLGIDGEGFSAYLSSQKLDIDILGEPGQTVTLGLIVTMDQSVTVNATSTPIAAANPDRHSIMLLNTGSVTVYVTTASTATTSHLPVDPGVSVTFDHGQAINGIVASGTGTVYVVEESA